MAQFIQNILWNSVSGFVEAGTRTAGGYAGDALIKAGDLIENGGRSVGNGIERRASNYGSAISGQTYKPSATPLPARKPAIKRSHSTPASSKPTTGATKYSAPAKKALASSGSSITGTKPSTAPKSLPAAKPAQKALPKPYTPSGNLSYASPGDKKTAVKPGQPKPFIVAQAAPGKEDKSKPYPGTNTLPGQGGKTPVKAKAPPRMKAPVEKGKVQHISF